MGNTNRQDQMNLELIKMLEESLNDRKKFQDAISRLQMILEKGVTATNTETEQ